MRLHAGDGGRELYDPDNLLEATAEELDGVLTPRESSLLQTAIVAERGESLRRRRRGHRDRADCCRRRSSLLRSRGTRDPVGSVETARGLAKSPLMRVATLYLRHPIRAIRFHVRMRRVRRKQLDLMTGLRSSRALLSNLHVTDMQGSLILLDVDGLRGINNAEGMEAGNAVILAVAKLIHTEAPKDSGYRLGGDEFAIILGPTFGSPSSLAERLRTQIEQETPLTATISVTDLEEPGGTLEDAIKAGDALLLQGKESGGKLCRIVRGTRYGTISTLKHLAKNRATAPRVRPSILRGRC